MAHTKQLSQFGSSQVLIRFAVTSIILASCAAFSDNGFFRGLAALTWMASIVSVLAGLITGERPFQPTLNRWDEAIGYATMFCLVSTFAHEVPT